MLTDPVVSVILPTFNRQLLVARTLASLLEQKTSTSFEILVVNNASTDRTQEIVEQFAARDPRVRPISEPRPGSSYARNTGIEHARSSILAFLDDDNLAAPDWIEQIHRCVASHPEIACAGGKVLPQWAEPLPGWLTPTHWSALGLVDYGEQSFCIAPDHAVCLLTGNLVARRSAFDRVGLFSTELQRIRDRTGSVEDHEWEMRLIRAGERLMYVPEMLVYSEVPANRMRKQYHRSWHSGHGYFTALMELTTEEIHFREFLGVPRWVWRDAATNVLKMSTARMRGGDYFCHELRLHWLAGYCASYRRNRIQPGKNQHE